MIRIRHTGYFFGFFLLSLIYQSTLANSLQIFTNSTFINPATLATVQNTEVIVGGTIPNIYYEYSGRALNNEGTVTSNKTFVLPYFRYSQRLSPKWVAGFDVVNPTVDAVSWPADGFQSPLGVDAIVQAREYIPKISYNFNQSFAIGAGFRIYHIYNVQLNYTVPFEGFVLNRATGVNYGGTLGFWYKINPTTFLDGTYFSAIKSSASGESILGNRVNNEYYIKALDFLPHTFILNLTHIFTPKFLMSAKLAYSLWSSDQQLLLYNTATPVNPTVFPLNWQNTIFTSLFARYQLTPKAAFFAAIGYDQSLVSAQNNLVGFPIGHIYIGTVGTQLQLTKTTQLQLLVGQGRVNHPDIDSNVAFGDALARFTFADLSLTFKF